MDKPIDGFATRFEEELWNEVERLRAEYDLALTMLLERGMLPGEFEARLEAPQGGGE